MSEETIGFGLTSPPALGGTERLTGSHGQHYAPLPANSISTPDDPPTSDDMEASTFAAIGFGIAAFCIVGGLIYLGTSFALPQ